MNDFVRPLLAFMTILSILMLGAGCTKDKVLRLKDKEIIRWDQMMQEVKDKNIILIGGLHEEPKHHKYQLRIIKGLYEQGLPIAIGLEMFKASEQPVLDNWVAGHLTLDHFLATYSTGWPGLWPLHRDIFLFAKDGKIPLIGLNVPPEIPMNVARKGYASLSKEEARQLPPGISCNVDETYMEFIKRVYSVRSSGKDFINFCEAQMVWDNAMALHALQYLERHPQATVIILSGTDHAWKRAIPRQIERLRGGYTLSVILPEHTNIEREIMTVDDTDFLLLQ